jgi:hypothetical protein
MALTVPVSATRFTSRRWTSTIRTLIGPITPRRRFQLALGVIWLVDAALQYQPYMFTKGFVTYQLASTAGGNPNVIAAPITWASNIMVQHIGIYNTIFATIQLAIAVGLLWHRSVKLALAASIPWAIAVWWFGEGLGGVLTGAVNAFMGAPGAVILYAFVAVLLWPRRDRAATDRAGSSVATGGPLGSMLPRLLTLSLWASFIYFMLLPADRNNTSLGTMIAGMDTGEPGWLRSMDHTIGHALIGHGTVVAYVFVVLCAVAGLGLFVPRLVKVAVLTGVVLGVAIWVAEDFGGILTGQGTDVNSGPLVALLAASFWPLAGQVGRTTGTVSRSALVVTRSASARLPNTSVNVQP